MCRASKQQGKVSTVPRSSPLSSNLSRVASTAPESTRSTHLPSSHPHAVAQLPITQDATLAWLTQILIKPSCLWPYVQSHKHGLGTCRERVEEAN